MVDRIQLANQAKPLRTDPSQLHDIAGPVEGGLADGGGRVDDVYKAELVRGTGDRGEELVAVNYQLVAPVVRLEIRRFQDAEEARLF